MNQRRITGLVVMCLIGLVAVSAMGSVADLERMATREFVPEIQLAAGIALGRHYATVKTLAEMEALATDVRATPGMRMAAQVALEHLFVTAGKTLDELLVIAKTGATVELRRAALPALERFLFVIAPTVAETAEITGIPEEDLAALPVAKLRVKYLRALAEEGVTAEIRLVGARGLIFPHRIKALRLEKIAREAIGEIAQAHLRAMGLVEVVSAELAIAAGENLGGWLLFHPEVVKTKGELVELTRTGETEGLRIAGSVALRVRLIAGDMTARALMDRLLAIMGTFSAEYRAAYMWALADRLAVP